MAILIFFGFRYTFSLFKGLLGPLQLKISFEFFILLLKLLDTHILLFNLVSEILNHREDGTQRASASRTKGEVKAIRKESN